MPYLQFDLDAKAAVPKAARAAGVPEAVLGWGLLELWEWCWREKKDEVAPILLAGFFGSSEAVPAALVAFDFLERLENGTYRVRGAERYLRLSAARRRAGVERAAKSARNGAGRLMSTTPAADQHNTSTPPAHAGEPTSTPPAADQLLQRASSIEHREEKKKSADAAFALESPKAKRERKPSSQEQFAGWYESERKATLGDEWQEDRSLGVSRLNRELSWIQAEDAETVAEAVRLYLEDPYRRKQQPPCSLLWFSRDRAEYLSRARAGAA